MTLAISPKHKPTFVAIVAASALGLGLIAAGCLTAYFGYTYLQQSNSLHSVGLAVTLIALWSLLVLSAAGACALQTYRIVCDSVQARQRLTRSRIATRRSKQHGTI